MREITYYNQERLDIASYIPADTKRILDIGCGLGYFLKIVKEQTGAETWGIESVAEIAEKANADKVLTGKVENLVDLIPNDYFDCVTFNDVLEHLLEPTEVLKMIKPKLSDVGIVIASVPNVRYFENLYELIIKKDWEYKDFGILDSTHLRFFTRKSMKRMFEDAGYRIVEQIGINMNTSWKIKMLNSLSFGLHSDIRYQQFVCIASKY